MEKIYLPSNMFLDIDHGMCRTIAIAGGQNVIPDRINTILQKRQIPCPIEEFIMQYPVFKLDGLTSKSYQWLMDKYRDVIFKLSPLYKSTIKLISTSYSSGLSNEIQFVIGYDYDIECDIIDELEQNIKKVPSYNRIQLCHNSEIKLNEFDTIFIKVLNEDIMKRLSDENVSMKKIYVADYNFNTVEDDNGNKSIPLEYMAEFEKSGDVVYTISMY